MSLCPHRDLGIAEHCPEQAEHAAALLADARAAVEPWPDGGHLPCPQITWSDARPGPSQPVPDYVCGTQEPTTPSFWESRVGLWTAYALVLFGLALAYHVIYALAPLPDWPGSLSGTAYSVEHAATGRLPR